MSVSALAAFQKRFNQSHVDHSLLCGVNTLKATFMFTLLLIACVSGNGYARFSERFFSVLRMRDMLL